MSRYNIIVRLAALRRTQKDVMAELAKLGFTVRPSEFSVFVNGYADHQPKAERILALADKIITRWEEDACVSGKQAMDAARPGELAR